MAINASRRNNVSHHQLENDLTHLERIVPQRFSNTQQACVYWSERITALKAMQAILPNGALRVTRLLRPPRKAPQQIGSPVKANSRSLMVLSVATNNTPNHLRIGQ